MQQEKGFVIRCTSFHLFYLQYKNLWCVYELREAAAGVLGHTSNPSTCKAGQEDGKLQASLGYITGREREELERGGKEGGRTERRERVEMRKEMEYARMLA